MFVPSLSWQNDHFYINGQKGLVFIVRFSGVCPEVYIQSLSWQLIVCSIRIS
eukprot:COSAG06_NODE_2783_length_6290_cov_3.541916_3_plen_52_part_00